MLNNIEDIKLFIEWCKEKKVKSFKSDNIQFELSELSFIDNTEDYADKLKPVSKNLNLKKNNKIKKMRKCFSGHLIHRIKVCLKK